MYTLVTGASGFIGRALCAALIAQEVKVRCVSRRADMFVSSIPQTVISHQAGEWVSVGDIGPDTDWTAALDNVDAVVHLAARAHLMKECVRDSLAEYRRVNVLGTERLFQMAQSAGVRRFVYVSSIGVNGRVTTDYPFTEESSIKPEDPYAVSKWEAECVLPNRANESGMEIVIIRPPLVYGPGVPGNFLRLLHWVDKGMPLPLGSIRNRRSLIALDNLVDILMLCLKHPHAVGEIFSVSDGESLSTPELIRRLARELGRSVRLVPFPENFLRCAARLLGCQKDMERLFSSLEIDSTKMRLLLDWVPSISVDEGLRRTAHWYLAK